MMGFSTIKCVTGFLVYRSFKKEFVEVYGEGMNENDAFWNTNQMAPSSLNNQNAVGVDQPQREPAVNDPEQQQ